MQMDLSKVLLILIISTLICGAPPGFSSPPVAANHSQKQFQLIPGATFTRMRHRPLAPLRTFAKLETDGGKSIEGNPLVRYEMQFPDVNRTLKIYFERDFPYRIQSWEDTNHFSNGTDSGEKFLITSATRTHTMLIDYWNYNHNKDRKILKKLGLGNREMN